MFIAAAPNGSSVWVRVIGEVTGALFDKKITTDLLANTQFLSPRLFTNYGSTAAAVAYDCSGVYVVTNYWHKPQMQVLGLDSARSHADPIARPSRQDIPLHGDKTGPGLAVIVRD